MTNINLDLTGMVFGYWCVQRPTIPNVFDYKYFCRCKCGAEKDVWQGGLKSGASKSCGCFRDEVATTHGESRTRLYTIHNTMKQRCTNPNDQAYAGYGGRGITIYPPWLDYETFRDWALANGYAEDLTIDRKDTHGNYEPDNCRWADKIAQGRNKRKRQNTSSQYQGVSYEKPRDRWKATIKHNGKSVFLGRFQTEEEAAQARDNYIKAEGLKDFPLNF